MGLRLQSLLVERFGRVALGCRVRGFGILGPRVLGTCCAALEDQRCRWDSKHWVQIISIVAACSTRAIAFVYPANLSRDPSIQTNDNYIGPTV